MILVLDEGTTSTRAVLFSANGAIHGCARRAIESRYPGAGWVEQDAVAIWRDTLACAREVVAAAGGADRISAIGIANQRETIVAWDRATGEPLAPAIVWQDRRTAETCAKLVERGHEEAVSAATGLQINPYFSATKIGWMHEHVPAVREAGERLMVGTIDSWLAFKLTRGEHVTDASNASRTMLMRLAADGWDDGLCDLFGVRAAALPKIVDSAGIVGVTDPALFGRAIPIAAMVGDQQAATIGQGCLTPGATKATFGTGAFMLTHAGRSPPRSSHRLLTTVLSQVGGRRDYALEGSLFVAGSMIQWLRDQLGIIASAPETEALARSVANSGGVTVVPAFAGLGAPHWRSDLAGSIHGLTLETGRGELIRAALESIVHQIVDLADAFAADGARWTMIRADGGMIANDWLAQDLADMLRLPVERPANVESTARGAAMLASVGIGLHRSIDDAALAMLPPMQLFEPGLDDATREQRLARWHRVLAGVLDEGGG
ncbi:MAG: FGGY family carbohydrate kinase [Sphingomicrobium sp.]